MLYWIGGLNKVKRVIGMCTIFRKTELKEHALRSGFNILDSFYSDGSSGNLAIYQVWQVAQDNQGIHIFKMMA